MLNKLLGAMPKHPNLVINDPKGTLLGHMGKNLKLQHYQIEELNITNLHHSNYYNPLAIITKEVNDGNNYYAHWLLSVLAGALFQTTNYQDNKSNLKADASELFMGLAFNNIAQAYHAYHDKKSKYYHDEKVWDKVNIANVINTATTLGGEKTKYNDNEMDNGFVMLNSKLRAIKKSQKRLSPVQKEYYYLLNQSVVHYHQSKHYRIHEGSVYTTFMVYLRIFLQPDVKNLTSRNEFNFDKLLVHRMLSVKFDPRDKYDSVSVRLYNTYPKKTADEFYKQQLLLSSTVADIPINHKINFNHITFTAVITAHSQERRCSRTTILDCNVNGQIHIRQNNAHVQRASMIFNDKPIALFIKTTPMPDSCRFNQLGAIMMSQIAWNAVEYPLYHGLLKQSNLDIIINHAEKVREIAFDVSALMMRIIQDKHTDMTLVLPDKPKKLKDFKEISSFLNKVCPDKINRHKHGYIMSSNIINAISGISDLYDKDHFYPDTVQYINHISLQTPPKNFDYQIMYNQLKYWYKSTHSHIKQAHQVQKLALTDNYIAVKANPHHECAWGLVINASHKTKLALRLRYLKYHQIEKGNQRKEEINDIQVLFHVHQALNYDGYYILPINHIIAVK